MNQHGKLLCSGLGSCAFWLVCNTALLNEYHMSAQCNNEMDLVSVQLICLSVVYIRNVGPVVWPLIRITTPMTRLPVCFTFQNTITIWLPVNPSSKID